MSLKQWSLSVASSKFPIDNFTVKSGNMPAAPKQRKIAIVGSRSVGMASITSCWLWICPGFGANLMSVHLLLIHCTRQIFPHCSFRRASFCRKLLSDNRKHIQPNHQVQWTRFRNGNRRYSWSSTEIFVGTTIKKCSFCNRMNTVSWILNISLGSMGILLPTQWLLVNPLIWFGLFETRY